MNSKTACKSIGILGYLFFLMTSLNTIQSQNLLGIDGSITIGNDTTQMPLPGTIRFDGLNFQGWNGYSWVSLTKFQVDSTLTDIDGNIYRTIQIGGQTWMAENLKTTKYRDGSVINDPGMGVIHQWIYNNSTENLSKYGRLYDKIAVNHTSGLCPTGWHVSTMQDWEVLESFLGAPQAGGKLKEEGTDFWLAPNTGARNDYGFSARPGGLYSLGLMQFGGEGVNTHFFAQDQGNGAFVRLSFDSPTINSTIILTTNALSVRCVKD